MVRQNRPRPTVFDRFLDVKKGVSGVLEFIQNSHVVAPRDLRHKLCRPRGQLGNKLLHFWIGDLGNSLLPDLGCVIPKSYPLTHVLKVSMGEPFHFGKVRR